MSDRTDTKRTSRGPRCARAPHVEAALQRIERALTRSRPGEWIDVCVTMFEAAAERRPLIRLIASGNKTHVESRRTSEAGS